MYNIILYLGIPHIHDTSKCQTYAQKEIWHCLISDMTNEGTLLLNSVKTGLIRFFVLFDQQLEAAAL